MTLQTNEQKERIMNFYLKSFCIFFRIGLFTIGGGYAMVPLIEREIVEKQKWIKKEDFLDLLALAQTVPGIFAVNIAIFIGYKLKKFHGALAMTLGTVLPSFLIILSIALFFRQYQHVEIVERIFKGIRPAVAALIASPCFKMAQAAHINKYNSWIPIVSALLIWLLGFSPIYIIILTGIGGYLFGRFQRHQMKIQKNTSANDIDVHQTKDIQNNQTEYFKSTKKGGQDK